MEAVGLVLMVFVLGLFGFGVYVAYVRQQSRSLERSPTRALTGNDHWYKQSLRLVRLLSKIQSDEMLWPVFPESLRDQVEVELERFWAESSK